jgi:hypothetical protein
MVSLIAVHGMMQISVLSGPFRSDDHRAAFAASFGRRRMKPGIGVLQATLATATALTVNTPLLHTAH